MLRLFLGSCNLFFLIYAQSFLITSVLGMGPDPMTASSSALSSTGAIKAEFFFVAICFSLEKGLLARGFLLSLYRVLRQSIFNFSPGDDSCLA